jgi:hypothetical protein
LETDIGGLMPGARPFDFFGNWTALAIGGGILGALAAIALAILMIRDARRNARLTLTARMYERMLNRARWLGIREETFATPLERAQAINRVLVRASTEANQIAACYTRERFGAKIAGDEISELKSAWSRWRMEWWRGFALHLRDRLLAPLRAFAETLRSWNRRIERIQVET